MLTVRPKETVSMYTRDRIRLDADVYRPDAEGPFPVLLMRQPYGRAIASTVVYAHPTWYAAHGYIVVIQDVRGRGTSEGDFHLFAHELADGYDAVMWAADLPGSTGAVGMYGFSYQGMTQIYAAVQQPSALKALCPAMLASDLYSEWAYEGGAFCLQANLMWAMQLAAETVRRQGDTDAYQTLYGTARNLPFGDPTSARSGILKNFVPESFYYDWLAHPQPDAYWHRLSPKGWLDAVDLPMLHIGGWFDPFLRGTLNLYRALAARSGQRQQLVVGPWGHLPWGRKVGALDYGPEAASPCDRMQIRWFDQFLKGLDTGLTQEPPVQLFEMGSNSWRSFDRWPPHGQQAYFLGSSGQASLTDQDGTLQPQSAPTRAASDVWVHDPWRPVPALGGHAAIPSGAFDRSSLDCRTDVVTYTTAPLTAELHLVGEITAQLYCQADAVSFDLCVVLSEVDPDGRVYNFSQGYRRLEGDPSGPITIELQPTCIRLPSGHALRLSVSAACVPAFPMNPGTGTRPDQAHLLEAQVITLSLQSGGDCPSHVSLPLLPSAGES